MSFPSRLHRSYRYAYPVIFGVLTATCLAQQPAPPAPLTQAESAASVAQFQQYYGGKHAEVAISGLALLAAEPNNHGLRFIVANSLYWTGNPDEAIKQYQALAGTEFESKANLALANLLRWSGHPERAEPLYASVLEKEPDNQDAWEGIVYATRDLRQRSQLRIGNTADSNDLRTTWSTVSHRWRDASKVQSFEIEAGAVRGERLESHYQQRDLTFRYGNANLPLEPQLELSAQESPATKLFGTLALKISDRPVTMSIGHVNWGKMALDPNALKDGLTATRLGFSTFFANSLGQWRGNYNAYRISDSNLIQDFNMQYAPAWQPFTTPNVKAFVGFNGHSARFNDPRYWSPEEAYVSVVTGIDAAWFMLDWQNYISGQIGKPVRGGDMLNWSVGAGAKRWLNRDWALEFKLWTLRGQRSEAYNAHALTMTLEKLW